MKFLVLVLVCGYRTVAFRLNMTPKHQRLVTCGRIFQGCAGYYREMAGDDISRGVRQAVLDLEIRIARPHPLQDEWSAG